MAKKQANIKQKGTFKHKNKIYNVEILKSRNAEIYNFYNEESILLLCSFFIKYKSKIVGVKQSGDFNIETYGNLEIYYTFIDKIKQIRDNKNRGIEGGRSEYNREIGVFTKVFEDSVPGEYSYKLISSDGITLMENIEIFDEEGQIETIIDYEIDNIGKEVKVTKVKGVKYQKKEREDNFIRPPEINDLYTITLMTGKDFSFLKKKNYRVLLTTEELDDYIEKIKNTDGLIGFDTETTGLNINRIPLNHPKRDKLAGICLSVEDDEGVYIPVGHKFIPNLDEKMVMEKLKPYICKTGIHKKNLGTHYGSFDWKVMWTYGIDLNIVHDSYILYYLLNNSAFRERKDLKEIARRDFNIDMVELDDIFKKRGRRKVDKNFALLPLESIVSYAPADADITRMIIKSKVKELPRSMQMLYGIEIELMKYLARIEYYGIKLNINKLLELKEETEVELEESEKKIYNFVGREFKITSSKELPKILYEELRYPILSKTEKGAPSTGKLAIKLLSEEKNTKGEYKYPLAPMVGEYRKYRKLLEGFIYKMLDENVEGYIFPKYNQTGTDSGRISCSGPNLQQSPGSHREVFITDSEDYYFIVVDYSQVEYRVMAGIAREKEIIESFRDPETDHHVKMYSRMFNVEQDLVNSMQRKIGKTLNFGVTYGMGDKSLALTLFKSCEKEKEREAGDLKERYFSSVPYIRDMMTDAGDFAQLKGYITTKYGRRRYIPEINSEIDYKRVSGRRKAANTKIQGTAADILKIAHVRVEKEIERLNLDAQVKLSMHDELALQVNKKISPWFMLELLRDRMELNIPNFPPLFIGSNVGNTWAVGKRDDLEIPIKLIERKVAESKANNSYETYDDPEKEISAIIKQYMIEKIEEVINNRDLKTKKEIMEFPKIEKIIKDYFGKENSSSIVDYILEKMSKESQEKIEEDRDKVIYINNTVNYDDEAEEADGLEEYLEDEEQEERERIDIRAVERLHTEDKDRLVLEAPEVKNAVEYCRENYKINIFNRKCYIDIDGVTKTNFNVLKKYLIENREKSNRGYRVILIKNNKPIKTKLYLYKVDKIKLMMIIEGTELGVAN